MPARPPGWVHFIAATTGKTNSLFCWHFSANAMKCAVKTSPAQWYQPRRKCLLLTQMTIFNPQRSLRTQRNIHTLPVCVVARNKPSSGDCRPVMRFSHGGRKRRDRQARQVEKYPAVSYRRLKALCHTRKTLAKCFFSTAMPANIGQNQIITRNRSLLTIRHQYRIGTDNDNPFAMLINGSLIAMNGRWDIGGKMQY